jgi:hypothetical protein
VDTAVLAALDDAMFRGQRVCVILRGDAYSGQASRMVEGVPRNYRTSRDGRSRVVLELVGNEVEQVIVMDRIVRVVPRRLTTRP